MSARDWDGWLERVRAAVPASRFATSQEIAAAVGSWSLVTIRNYWLPALLKRALVERKDDTDERGSPVATYRRL